MTELDKSQMIQVIIHICQKYNCVINHLDLDNRIIDLAGPPDNQEKVRQELKQFLE